MLRWDESKSAPESLGCKGRKAAWLWPMAGVNLEAAHDGGEPS